MKKVKEKIEDGPLAKSWPLFVEGKGGICRDVVASYYPLLKYFGYNVGFKEGPVSDTTERDLHVWLNVNLDGKNFELDPSWYGEAVPLESRI